MVSEGRVGMSHSETQTAPALIACSITHREGGSGDLSRFHLHVTSFHNFASSCILKKIFLLRALVHLSLRGDSTQCTKFPLDLQKIDC